MIRRGLGDRVSFYGIWLVGLFSVFALWIFVSLSSSLIYSFLCD